MKIQKVEQEKKIQEKVEEMEFFDVKNANDANDLSWLMNFKQLKEFFSANDGKYPSINAKKKKEQSLAIWVSAQRRAYKKGKLRQDRKERLSQIGFKLDPYEEGWESKLNAFKMFLLDNNGRYPSSVAKNKEEKMLGAWVNKQRNLYRIGSLRRSREEQLNQIGFRWVALEGEWEKVFHSFTIFLKENNGRYPNNASDNQEEKQLANWVRVQRREFKLGNLKPDRKHKLDGIGFVYDLLEDEWDYKFQAVKKFKNENRRYPKRNTGNKEEDQLFNWILLQRKTYKTGTLSEKRIDKLNGIGFQWNQFEDVWHKNNNEVQEFISVNGRYPRTEAKDEEERKLGVWVSNQRQAIKKGKISLTRYRLLRRQKFIEDLKEEKNLTKANEQFFQEADQEWSR